MSLIVYDKDGNKKEIVEKDDISVLNNRFISYDVFNTFNINNPVEGLKKVYYEIPISNFPIFVHLNCGAQYIGIVQKTSANYGSAIIFGYSIANPRYLRLSNGQWSDISL